MKVVIFWPVNTKNYTKEHKFAKMCTHEGDVIQYDILDPVYVGSDASGNLGKVTIPQCSHSLNKLTGWG